MNSFISYNGIISDAGEAILTAANRGYRYGDGIFETMKMRNGKIMLESLHMERLANSLELLKINFSWPGDKLKNEIAVLCRKNNCTDLARIRLSLSRGNGHLTTETNQPQYLIECWPLPELTEKFNENGLKADIFPDARKSMDMFSGLKTASYLPYVMAAVFARENKLDEALVLNSDGRICDASIANVFWVKDGEIFTPPLGEGCIAGVMRRYLLTRLPGAGFIIKEKKLETEELEKADEIFLTNAITGIRWVGQYRNKKFDNKVSGEIYYGLVQTMSG